MIMIFVFRKEGWGGDCIAQLPACGPEEAVRETHEWGGRGVVVGEGRLN